MRRSLTRLAPSPASSSSSTATTSFFPLASTAPSTVKPTSQLWYTARPDLLSTVQSLHRAVVATRNYLFQSGLLPSVTAPLSALPDLSTDSKGAGQQGRRWYSRTEMGEFLRNGVKLRNGEYNRLTRMLGELERLAPYTAVAASLGGPVLPISAAAGAEHGEIVKALRLPKVVIAGVETDGRPAGAGTAAVKDQVDSLLDLFQKDTLGLGQEGQSLVGRARPLARKDEEGRWYAVGKRKESAARVWLVPASSASSPPPEDVKLGTVLVNALPLSTYFSVLSHRSSVLRPFRLTSSLGAFNVFVIAKGGGVAAQADATALGIAKALVGWQEERSTVAGAAQQDTEDWRGILKKAGLLTRDPRMVERKKTGQPKARKKNAWRRR